MDFIRRSEQTQLDTGKSRSSLSIYRDVSRPRGFKSNNNTKTNRNNKCHRYAKHILTVVASLSITSPVLANTDVGGVSATANPIANSSGSVTNQAIQVLQGPYITNTYGGGIQCQGPTANITPYITSSESQQWPYEAYYQDPVYDMSTDDNGDLINPGSILYHIPTRTGQKDNYSLSAGFSATISMPLDRKLQKQCKEAAAVQISLQEQVTANKRLDFEIARLKNCGELMKANIRFKAGTKYAKICEDVEVVGVTNLPNHVHKINYTEVKVEPEKKEEGGQEAVTSEVTSSAPFSPYSIHADPTVFVQSKDEESPSQELSSEQDQQSSSQQASQLSITDPQWVLQKGRMSLQQWQSPQ